MKQIRLTVTTKHQVLTIEPLPKEVEVTNKTPDLEYIGQYGYQARGFWMMIASLLKVAYQCGLHGERLQVKLNEEVLLEAKERS